MVSDVEFRSLISMEKTASTARVLNLRKVYTDNKDLEEYQKNKFFYNETLNRSIIVKHRLRINEREDFNDFRTIVTKLMVPLDVNDLTLGALYVFIDQINFVKMLSNSLHKTESELHRDIAILRAIDKIPTLDPFLLREHLDRQGIKPATCYFQISEHDTVRMLDFVENEMGALVRMSFGEKDNDQNATILTKKLLSNSSADDTEALRLTLRMDSIQYKEGIFCWKAFLYYKWQLKDLMPKSAKILLEIETAYPRGPITNDEKLQLHSMREAILTNFTKACSDVSETLSVYDNAYYMLTKKSDPLVFKNFLLSAPNLFKALGERLGAIQHLLSFWRYRVPEGQRPTMTVEEMLDIFGDFENSLNVTNEHEQTANPIIDTSPSY